MRHPTQRDARQLPLDDAAQTDAVRIRFDGRDFFTTTQMAGIFLRHAQQVLDSGDAQLVPLSHREGIELLLVSANVVFSVHDAG